MFGRDGSARRRRFGGQLAPRSDRSRSPGRVGSASITLLNRANLLAGQTTTPIFRQLSNSYSSLLPADFDGSMAPPSGAPMYFLSLGGSTSLRLWTASNVDFGSASMTLTGPASITVPFYTKAACGSYNCVPQPGTSTKLDTLGDRLLHRLAYRNLGASASLVANHSVYVDSAGPTGVRWYELRSDNATPTAFTAYQSGTFAPTDGNHRWMGSIAMDKSGDIAVGYSVSGAVKPSIRFASRAPLDPIGQLQPETSLVDGAGVQSQSRWGDYTSINLDPVDDCTFWYTNQYLKTDGAWNWNTRIASFKFQGCP